MSSKELELKVKCLNCTFEQRNGVSKELCVCVCVCVRACVYV